MVISDYYQEDPYYGTKSCYCRNHLKTVFICHRKVDCLSDNIRYY